MSVYTLLSQNQLRDLLEKYALGNIEKVEEISDGIENSNYLIKAWQQDYVLTIFEQYDAPRLLPYLSFMLKAEEKGFPFPSPIKNNLGERLSFFEYKGKRKQFIVCKKLPGKHPVQIDEQLCAELGKQFASIHFLSQEESIKSLIHFSGLDFIFPESPIDFLDEAKQAHVEKLQSLINSLKTDFSELPKGICHCDFFPDNALVISDGTEQKFSGFLDWYDAQHTFFILDLAIIAISWCKDANNTLNADKINALLTAYQSIRPFSALENKRWKDFLKIAAGIFWLSRECYVQRMKKEGKQAKNTKQPEEFYSLLLALDTL